MNDIYRRDARSCPFCGSRTVCDLGKVIYCSDCGVRVVSAKVRGIDYSAQEIWAGEPSRAAEGEGK